jgi:hypothetical protein
MPRLNLIFPDSQGHLNHQNLVMEQNHEVSRPFFRQYSSKPRDLGDFTSGLMAWEGDKDISWTTDEDGA